MHKSAISSPFTKHAKFKLTLFVFSTVRAPFFGKSSSFESHGSQLTSGVYTANYILVYYLEQVMYFDNAKHGWFPKSLHRYRVTLLPLWHMSPSGAMLPQTICSTGTLGRDTLKLSGATTPVPSCMMRSQEVCTCARPWRMAVLWPMQAWGSITAQGPAGRVHLPYLPGAYSAARVSPGLGDRQMLLKNLWKSW